MDANTVTGVLNDLIKINNDRVEGYRKAIEELEDKSGDLVSIFNNCIAGSEKNKQELFKMAGQYDADNTNGTTLPGDIYRAWMDMKAAFTGDNRLTVLESCEYGEDAAQKAYKEAIDKYNDLPVHIAQLIITQKADLREAHDKVKRLRDLEKKETI